MTTVVHTIAELHLAFASRDVVLVPTMGALHDGHLTLVRAARELGQEVVVSIFVNPTQFAAGEDFERYPRTLDADLALLEAEGVQWVFAPSAEEIYPTTGSSEVSPSVRAGAVGDRFEGAIRPGHFDGVLTVVLKLFSIVQPRVAVFGEKDAQQLALIRLMVRAFNLPVQIAGIATARDADGLAQSSRNRYLTSDERAAAPAIWQALQLTASLVPERGIAAALEAGRSHIAGHSLLEIDYFDAVDPESFLPFPQVTNPTLIVAAVRAGRTRLIDNLTLD